MLLERDLLDPDRPFVVRQSRPDLAKDAAFLELCRLHPDLRLETDRDGTLVITSPSGWRSSNRNARTTGQLQAWADRDGTGQVSDSSGLFHVAGARRSPDAAWIRSDRVRKVPASEREHILPIVPDFVIELRFATFAATVNAHSDHRWPSSLQPINYTPAGRSHSGHSPSPHSSRSG